MITLLLAIFGILSLGIGIVLVATCMYSSRLTSSNFTPHSQEESHQ